MIITCFFYQSIPQGTFFLPSCSGLLLAGLMVDRSFSRLLASTPRPSPRFSSAAVRGFTGWGLQGRDDASGDHLSIGGRFETVCFYLFFLLSTVQSRFFFRSETNLTTRGVKWESSPGVGYNGLHMLATVGSKIWGAGIKANVLNVLVTHLIGENNISLNM